METELGQDLSIARCQIWPVFEKTVKFPFSGLYLKVLVDYEIRIRKELSLRRLWLFLHFRIEGSDLLD